MKKFVYQIFYNTSTRLSLDPGFIPLDNTANQRPDWFEFWVIRNYLRNLKLEDGAWYGFLSPKFGLKTGFKSNHVSDMLGQFDKNADVVLLTSDWDQLAFFLNPFEQGEFWHPGLLGLAQGFFDGIGFEVDLKSLATYSATAVFGNYVIAKREYWQKWLTLADKFWELLEGGTAKGGLLQNTFYGAATHLLPMKVFIQERFASVILSPGRFRVVAPDQSQYQGMSPLLFVDDSRTRRMLQTCDTLKEQYCRTADGDYLRMFRKVQNAVDLVGEFKGWRADAALPK